MTTITLEVNPEIAAAYQAVSSAEREQITKIVALLLQNPKESDLAFLRRIMDDISDKYLDKIIYTKRSLYSKASGLV